MLNSPLILRLPSTLLSLACRQAGVVSLSNHYSFTYFLTRTLPNHPAPKCTVIKSSFPLNENTSRQSPFWCGITLIILRLWFRESRPWPPAHTPGRKTLPPIPVHHASALTPTTYTSASHRPDYIFIFLWLW